MLFALFGLIAACVLSMTAAVGGAWAATDADADAAADSDSSTPIIGLTGEQLTAAEVGADADSTPKVSKGADAVTLDGCSFGLTEFTRYNTGTNKEVDGAYIGFRYFMVDADAFAAVMTDVGLLVYIPAETASSLGIDISDEKFQSDFLSMYQAIDKESSKGGQTYARLKPAVYFTSDDQLISGDFTYRFGVESGGRYYITVHKDGSDDGSEGAIYASTGRLLESGNVQIAERAQGFDALVEFFGKLDWSPLWVSLRTTGVAIVVIFILGLLAAWLTLRVSNKVKGVLDTVFTIPMVLPPTVCGFLLLMLFGNKSPTGDFFINVLHLDLVFTWPAAVIACIVVGFPMMYRTVRGAFENIDVNMLDAARTLGWKEGRIFLRIMLPLAWPSIAAGTVLAFARAMGEFGCTLFFAGNYVGVTQTIPLAIYFDWMGGKPDVALFWVIVVILISFLVILFINIYSSRTQRYRKRLGE